jgi:hypothetical protein
VPLTFAFLIEGDPVLAFKVVILFIIIQFIEDNILTPNIVGGNVNINPFFIITGLVAASNETIQQVDQKNSRLLSPKIELNNVTFPRSYVTFYGLNRNTFVSYNLKLRIYKMLKKMTGFRTCNNVQNSS